jgi:hypothetical protein
VRNRPFVQCDSARHGTRRYGVIHGTARWTCATQGIRLLNYWVVSLNCRDDTHPNVGTDTQWHAMDPSMLRKRDRAAIPWSSRHARCYLPPSPGPQGTPCAANRYLVWALQSATVLAHSGVAARDGQKPATPPTASSSTCIICAVAQSAFPYRQGAHCDLENRPVGIPSAVRSSVAQGLTIPVSAAMGLRCTVATTMPHHKPYFTGLPVALTIPVRAVQRLPVKQHHHGS